MAKEELVKRRVRTNNTELRNSTEIEADRLFLLSLLRKSGRDLDIQSATDALNAKRESAAREYARALGKSEEEIEEAAANSSLNRGTVASDIAAVRNSLQYAIESGAASWLDSQLEELQRDREQTYSIDEMALAELERSRHMRFKIERGIPVFGDEEPEELDEELREVVKTALQSGKGKPPSFGKKIPQVRSKEKTLTAGARPKGMQVVEIVERDQEQGGSPRFLEILNNNIRRRMELRSEERLLMFGRQWAQKVAKSDQQSAATFAKLLTGKQTPEEAEQAVLEAYQQELQQLVLAEEMELGPSDPAMVRMEKLRVQRQEQRLRELREYMKLNQRDREGPKIIEVVFEKVEPGKFKQPEKRIGPSEVSDARS